MSLWSDEGVENARFTDDKLKKETLSSLKTRSEHAMRTSARTPVLLAPTRIEDPRRRSARRHDPQNFIRLADVMSRCTTMKTRLTERSDHPMPCRMQNLSPP